MYYLYFKISAAPIIKSVIGTAIYWLHILGIGIMTENIAANTIYILYKYMIMCTKSNSTVVLFK